MRRLFYIIASICMSIEAVGVAFARQPERQPPAEVSEPENCVEVRISNAASKDFSCTNAGLKNAIKTSRAPSQIDTNIGVTSSPAKLGTFNIAAERLKMGENFGKSVVPYRPPTPVPSPGLGPSPVIPK
jgi:hypothetical protein